ncbi:MBOAT family protein [Hibiscus syriacus]|uniref:MBOAT family protein n=1 Tax=Hibiscus syriacus TaxID=106335 RepID=A0A6A3AUF2_HIBSY|nr:MBOAT family protein [Hibiscus syriacus]
MESTIKVWILATISLSYCFYVSSNLPKGIFRLISLIPIFILFLYLPLIISSAHLGGPTALFLAWPLCFRPTTALVAASEPFPFHFLASLPIKPKHTIPSQSKFKPPQRSNNTTHLPKSFLFAIKVYSTPDRILPDRSGFPLHEIVAVFVVSGLMYELIYYYLTRVAPTWEVTWFFISHGVAFAVEVAVKKVVPMKRRLHPPVSVTLALGFVRSLGILRNGVDEKIIGDYSKLVHSFKSHLHLSLSTAKKSVPISEDFRPHLRRNPSQPFTVRNPSQYSEMENQPPRLPSLKTIVYDSMINYISLADLRDVIKGWSSHLAKFLDAINYWTRSGNKKPKKLNITVIRDKTAPQQTSGARGDCGPLVCLALERLTTGSIKYLPPTDRDRAVVGLWFRHYMAKSIYTRRCLPASAL